MRNVPGHVKIATIADHNIAAIVRARLEDAGIEVFVPFERTSALRLPFIGAKSWLEVFVREEDEQAALAILDENVEFDDADPEAEPQHDDAEDCRCPNCGSDAIRLLRAPIWPIFLSMVWPGYSLHDVPSRWRCIACDRSWQVLIGQLDEETKREQD